MIFDALSNAAYRVSLHGTGDELEGRGVNTPGSARSVTSSGPAWVDPRPGRARVDVPPEFFCDARRTMSRIVLKFYIAYGASFAACATIGEKKLTGSCQVTEL